MEKKFEQRVYWYEQAFPGFPAPYVGEDGRLYAIWILGQDYQSKTGYHGSYPPNFLRRLGALFPEIFTKQCLHPCSGSLSKEDVGDAFRLDVNNSYEPDFVGDFLKMDLNQKFDVIAIDIPYTNQDANNYGVPMVDRFKFFRKCHEVLNVGGVLLWLDQIWPMYSKVLLDFCGLIHAVETNSLTNFLIAIKEQIKGEEFVKNNFDFDGIINIIRSTNHRVRDLFIFQKRLPFDTEMPLL